MGAARGAATAAPPAAQRSLALPRRGLVEHRASEDYDQIETFRNLAILVEKYGFDRRRPAIQAAGEAMQSLTPKDGVDQAFAGDGVLYFSRLISRASQSHLTQIISLPVYQSMTIRKWNTTTMLLSLMAAVG